MQDYAGKYVFFSLLSFLRATSSHSALRTFIKLVDSNLFLSRWLLQRAPPARVLCQPHLRRCDWGVQYIETSGRELRISLPSFHGISRLRNETAIFLTRLEALLSVSLLPFLGRCGLLPQREIETLRAGICNRAPAKSYSATSNLITSIRKDNKHRNNLPNV